MPVINNSAESQELVQVETSHSLVSPNIQQNPIWNHVKHKDPFISISLTYWNNHAFECKTIQFHKNADCAFLSEEQVLLLESVTKILHVLLINNDFERRAPYDPVSIATPDEIFTVACADYSPLHQFIFALSFGDGLLGAIEKSEEHAHSGWKWVTTQSFAATDIIQHLA
jgi:hypothetical protein